MSQSATREGVGYLRISDDREGLERGVERQRADIAARAERDRVAIIRWYEDNDKGASRHSRKPRKDYTQMLEDAAAGKVGQFIYSYSNSRLTRRPREFEDLIDLHDRTGVQIRTVVSGDDNLATADGRMVARIKAAADAAESDRVSERVGRETKERREAGRPHGGRRPFGWADRVSLDPNEHAVILECAQRIIAGETLKAIARDLTRRGVPTVNWHPPLALKPWSPTVLRQMLSSPRMIGYTSHAGEKVARGIWDPALDETTWRLLRALFKDPSRLTGVHVRRRLLTRLALCGECDQPMTSAVTGGRPQYVCPSCRLWRAARPIDAAIEEYAGEWLRHRDTDSDAAGPEPFPGDPVASGRAEFLQAKIDATKRVFTGDDTVTPAELLDILRGLKAELAAEEAKLVPSLQAQRRRVLEQADPDEFPDYPISRKRAIIGALCVVRLKRVPAGGGRGFDPESVVITRR